jgi:hypothetical protein
LYGVDAETETVTGVHIPVIIAEPETQVSQVGALVAPLAHAERENVALIVWSAVTFEKLYELATGFDAPSTLSDAMPYPLFGVIEYDFEAPEATLLAPAGATVPFAPDEAVIVYVAPPVTTTVAVAL